RGAGRAWVVGLGLAVGITLAAGGSAGARQPTCSSVTNGGSVFKILGNQTYALCAVAKCFVFNEVAYCTCDVLTGDSISPALQFDDQEVFTLNAEGKKNT